METNVTSRNTTRSLCEYSSHQIYKHLPKDVKPYVSFGLGLQGGITLFINTLVLVSIRQTNQVRKTSLKTTILLSVHDMIATSFATILMLFFTNYQVQDCKMPSSLLSIDIYLSQLNTSLMCFISLDRFLQVKFSRNYQRQFKSRVSIASLILGILWPVFQLASTNVKSSIVIKFITGVVSLLTNISVIILLLSFNLATFLVLQRHRQQSASLPSNINKKTLRLTQLYIISFAIFKIQIIPVLIILYTTSLPVKTKIIISYIAFNVSKLDGIVNSIIFFCINKTARSYLMKNLQKKKTSPS